MIVEHDDLRIIKNYIIGYSTLPCMIKVEMK